MLAAAYGSEATRWLLGDRLHPGAAALTAALLADAGVEVIVSERRDEAARHRRSRGRSSSPRPRARAGRPPELAGVFERALTIVSTARDAIADRELGYGTVVAQRSYGS